MASNIPEPTPGTSQHDDGGDETIEQNTCYTENNPTNKGTSMIEKEFSKLTIEEPSKIEKEKSKSTYDPNPSTLAVVFKWLATVCMFLIVLGCVLFSKITILALSASMNMPNTLPDDVARRFVMLQILLIVPNVISLLRGIWNVGFRKDLEWPNCRTLIVAIVVSLLESVGLCVFIFNITGLMKIHDALILMNGVFVLPVVNNLVSWWKKWKKCGKCLKFFVIFGLIIELVALIVVICLIRKEGGFRKEQLWIPVVSLVFLFVSWMPCTNRRLLEGTCCIKRTQAAPESPQPEENKQTRTSWKLTICMSLFKIIFISGTSMAIYGVRQLDTFRNETYEAAVNWTTYGNGWKWDDMYSREMYYFVLNIVTSIMGYLAAYIACTTRMHVGGFSLPLIHCTVVSIILIYTTASCNSIVLRFDKQDCEETIIEEYMAIIIFFVIFGHFCSVGLLNITSEIAVKQKEEKVFWLPTYNSVFLEQWLLLNRRITADTSDKTPDKPKRPKVFICTTMYREVEKEMKQLLESIKRVNESREGQDEHDFEAHVFFDGATRGINLSKQLLQLVSLVEKTLEQEAKSAVKEKTPYGMLLCWTLKKNKKEMRFKIHLKDNYKVKNKKRWSQVMYMSYVLDYLLKGANKESCFILTTDADVSFTPNSVKKLVDLMIRDERVGAVCARTHPIGTGPVVWYQVFEYAVGHWFQKTAEHVLGSVLCSPGCFSLYRCTAIADVLPEYATDVEQADEFLIKDMGEDRWFCSLLIQSGWRIEYCAASKNSTHCPEDFNEFFKQRRRWIVSTLANMVLLMKEWDTVRLMNHRVSTLFLVYEAILFFATLVGPSSVILVITGGLSYGWNWTESTSLTIQILICIGYTLVCLYTTSKTQLMVGKLLTFLFSILMTAVLVGMAVQIVTDLSTDNTIEHNFISESIHISTMTVYLVIMASIFITSGLLHLNEFVYLIHGVWYILCLPAGYLILVIYSICNITDMSWGTRDKKKISNEEQKTSWKDTLTNLLKYLRCCRVPEDREVRASPYEHLISFTEADNADDSLSDNDETNGSHGSSDSTNLAQDTTGHVSVETWLSNIGFSKGNEAATFKDNGYEDTRFIAGMTDGDLEKIGIRNRAKKKKLLEEIEKLPDFEIHPSIPEDVKKWLEEIGLEEYHCQFKKQHINSKTQLEILKTFNSTDIKKYLKIEKEGHIRRLLQAIDNLREPTNSEKIAKRIKGDLQTFSEQRDDKETEFWTKLKDMCLIPQPEAFVRTDHLREGLKDLRNSWLMVFAICNSLWLILVCTLAAKGNILRVFGSNPIGLVVLVLFGFIVVLQFLAMIVHRLSTLTHYLARIPYFPNNCCCKSSCCKCSCCKCCDSQESSGNNIA